MLVNAGVHRGTRVLSVPLRGLNKPRLPCRIMTVGQKDRALVPHNSSAVGLRSVMCFAAVEGCIPCVHGVTNGRSCTSIHGMVVVNKDQVTMHATRCIPSCVRIGVISGSLGHYGHLARLLSSHAVVVGNSKQSVSLLIRRKLGGARTFITLANGSRAGVLTYLTTGHVKIDGAMTRIRGVSCVNVTRDLSVNAIVGGGVVTTDRVCRVVLSTSIDGIGYLAFTGTSMTRFAIGTNSGVAGRPMGSLNLPGKAAVNKLVHRKRNIIIVNGALVRPNSRIIMFYLGVVVGGVRGCFGW